jgi:aspartate carbamoyltransferase regulatory subunit
MNIVTRDIAVAAIESGTVIDHIDAGKSILLLRLLKLEAHTMQVTVGINLLSAQMGMKDVIKADKRELSLQEASRIAVFSPQATINIIRNFAVVEKAAVTMPAVIEHCIICPNPQCITNHEKTSRSFDVLTHRKLIQLQCAFCERVWSRHEITQYAI